ncbi:MAG: molybdopterin synthase sulfur carrier subunit [Phycisphaerae bacterium]
MENFIHITVHFFGPAADYTGQSQAQYALASPARLSDLRELLFARYPKLQAAAATLRFAVNSGYVTDDAALSEGDEVAVIPPVAGGALEACGTSPMVEVTIDPIDVTALSKKAAHASCGAVVVFEGVVRREGEADNPLVALEYSAYHAMAVKLLGRIREEALQRYAIHEVLIVHRTGRLNIGETSMAVVISAPHRSDAFEACTWIIDAVKLDVPVWKREIWTRGEPTWVDPTQKASPTET